MKVRNIVHLMLLLGLMLAGSANTNAQTYIEKETTVTTTDQGTQVETTTTTETQFVDTTIVYGYPLTAAQRTSLDRVLREIRLQNTNVVFHEDDEAKEGEMVLVKWNHEYPREALPVRDDDENRVRVEIEADGDVKYKYIDDDDASGVKVDFDDSDDKVIIEYDYNKRLYTDIYPQ